MSSQRNLTFGQLLKEARASAELTQPQVAEVLAGDFGLSTSFYNDVEHDRKALLFRYWPALIERLPALSLESLAEAELRTRPVKIDARQLPPKQRNALGQIIVALAGGKL